MEVLFFIVMAMMLILIAAVNTAFFIAGFKLGAMTAKGEDVKMPRIQNPPKSKKEHGKESAAEREAEAEARRLEVIMRNIEGYDGTGQGQEDVP